MIIKSRYPGFELIQVVDFSILADFECDDKAIDRFIREDAARFQKERLASSYVLVQEKEHSLPLSYISVSTSDIRFPEKSVYRKHLYYKAKNYHSFPGIRIGRLGVHKAARGNGIGRATVEASIFLMRSYMDIAARFALVDAYPSVVGFYEKCGFTCIDDDTRHAKTTLMYLDLLRYTAHI